MTSTHLTRACKTPLVESTTITQLIIISGSNLLCVLFYIVAAATAGFRTSRGLRVMTLNTRSVNNDVHVGVCACLCEWGMKRIAAVPAVATALCLRKLQQQQPFEAYSEMLCIQTGNKKNIFLSQFHFTERNYLWKQRRFPFTDIQKETWIYVRISKETPKASSENNKVPIYELGW